MSDASIPTDWTQADRLLVGGLALGTLALLLKSGARWSRGDWVVIETDRKEVARIPLDADRIVQVRGPIGETRVEIRNGRARIAHSPCKNKICVKSGYIQYAERLVACVPNHVVVRVLGKKYPGLDAVAG
jgi:hypothetical protein